MNLDQQTAEALASAGALLDAASGSAEDDLWAVIGACRALAGAVEAQAAEIARLRAPGRAEGAPALAAQIAEPLMYLRDRLADADYREERAAIGALIDACATLADVAERQAAEIARLRRDLAEVIARTIAITDEHARAIRGIDRALGDLVARANE